MKGAFRVAVLAAATWIAAPAEAADIPNLIGEWSGTAEAVVIGSGGYRPGKQTLEDPPFVDQRVFNFRSRARTATGSGALSRAAPEPSHLPGPSRSTARRPMAPIPTAPSISSSAQTRDRALLYPGGPSNQIVATCFLIKRK
jgi:hypothetical protein